MLDIDVQGVKQIHNTNLNPWYVFIKPPSLEELEKRLRARNTESEESLAERLKVAAAEIEYGNLLVSFLIFCCNFIFIFIGLIPGHFDIVIVNNNLEDAYQQLKEFLLTKVLAQKNGIEEKVTHRN